MCGIYGTTISYPENQIKNKLERTAFRGPDQMGWNTLNGPERQITLGHNRLSIIDLDSRSNQPFTYLKTVHIVFNGEIYNFKIIRESLKKKGYLFNTTSDTEVICAAYLEYGQECVKLFNGMFAFVIYDEKEQLLFGAKDRLGQKPFYYYLNGKDFEFASQISSIQLYNSKLTISSQGIRDYLSWKCMPDPSSIFNEIKTLKDGHCFVYNLQDFSFKCTEYWNIDYRGRQKYSGTFDQAKTDLEGILSDAVKIRLYADVPVGVFLSGGIDSSIIAALATKHTSEKIKTFSVKFDEKEFDESEFALQVADHLKTDHHVISCNYKEGLDLIENFSYYYDEPFADASAIPTMLLSKYTRKHVTVALSGDGGDESFLGYSRYNWIARNKKYMAAPKVIRHLMANILSSLSKGNRARILSDLLKTNNIEEAYLKTAVKSGAEWMTPSDNVDYEEIKYLMHKDKNVFERASDFDIKTYLNWDINEKVDRASMAYSLEARAPLLDYRIVEFARSLPTPYKYQNGNQKRILKEILYQYVPKEFFDRPKAGFAMPFNLWFRNDLRQYVLSELSIENLRMIPGVRPEVVAKMVKEHMAEVWDHSPVIWKLLVLRQWLAKNGKGLSIK